MVLMFAMEYTSLKDVLMVLVYMAAIDYHHIKFGGENLLEWRPATFQYLTFTCHFVILIRHLMVTGAQEFLVFRWSRRRCFLILWHVPHSLFFSVRTRCFAASVNRDPVPGHVIVPGSLSQSCRGQLCLPLAIDVTGSCVCLEDASRDKCLRQSLRDSVTFSL